MKSELVREKYLDDPRFSRSDCQLLFQIRTRMLPVKTNFPTMWNNDKSCRTCLSCVEIESQEHMLTCPGLRKNVEIPSSLKYDDVFDHPDKQYKIVKAYRKLIREQEIMLNCSEQGSEYWNSTPACFFFFSPSEDGPVLHRITLSSSQWFSILLYYSIDMTCRINIYIYRND